MFTIHTIQMRSTRLIYFQNVIPAKTFLIILSQNFYIILKRQDKVLNQNNRCFWCSKKIGSWFTISFKVTVLDLEGCFIVKQHRRFQEATFDVLSKKNEIFFKNFPKRTDLHLLYIYKGIFFCTVIEKFFVKVNWKLLNRNSL